MRDRPGHAPIASSFRFSFVVAPVSMTDIIVLAFDFGARRIGVAIGNSLTREARPLTTIDALANDARWNAVEAVTEQWLPTQLVVGVPRYPDGAANPMTARCERFARQLKGRFGLPVARVDERYSSVVVERADDIDAAAAAVILQQWFDSGADDA